MLFRKSQLAAVLRESRRLVWTVVVALAAQSIISMVEPWPLQAIFDNIILKKPLKPLLMDLNLALSGRLLPHLLFLAVGFLIFIAVVNGFALYLQNIFLTRLIQQVIVKLRTRLFAHIMELPLAYFHKVGSGEIVSRVTSDTENMEALVEGMMVLTFRSAPTLVGIFAIMVWIDYPFAILTLALAPFLAWSTLFFGTRVKKATQRLRRHESSVATVAELATRTQKCLKLLGLEKQEVERLRRICASSRDAAVEAGSWQGFYTASTNAALAVGSALIVCVGVYRIRGGDITPGELLVFMSYLRSLYKPIRELAKYIGKISKAAACYDRIEEVMAITPSRMGVRESGRALPMPPFSKEIVFENVGFAYEPGTPVLKDVSFRMGKGQKVAVVGDSGSGKSTLLSLIPRFFDPTQGRILIDGRHYVDFQVESLREQIAVVPQECIIFHTTVFENIALGRPRGHADREEVFRAAKEANADEFIRELPNGYETILGTGFTQLSGGQCKRILISRALLRNTPIVLLDEPTSGLDPYSERHVMEAFDRLMKRRTILVVTHHLPFVMNADLIVVLKQGEVVEQGTHHELLRLGGHYYSFWMDQMEQFDR